MSLPLILAVLLDQWLGEPQKYHPLVFFGRFANLIENKIRLPQHSAFLQKTMGLLALLILLTPFSWFIYQLSQWPLINTLLSPIALYICIAPHSLKQHALSVFQALNENNLTLAQNRVAMIVSRQTDKMDVTEIRKATIESVLENGADAVFAPIFWFIIAGPTGAVIYRLSNTLDAMWGYKNQRFLHFGWAAARFDDALNWIPARLTALTYAVLGQTRKALFCWKTQAKLLESPNAGPVMASGAGALNLQLGGPAWYHGKLKDKVFFGGVKLPNNHDIKRANSLIYASLILWIIIIIILEILGENLA